MLFDSTVNLLSDSQWQRRGLPSEKRHQSKGQANPSYDRDERIQTGTDSDSRIIREILGVSLVTCLLKAAAASTRDGEKQGARIEEEGGDFPM